MKIANLTRPAALAAVLFSAACASGPAMKVSSTPPSPDPRVGLAAGVWNAATAAWNVKLLSNTPPSKDFYNTTPWALTLANSDLAFNGHYVVQGNFSGYQVWDVANPAKVALHTAYVCPGSQADVSFYKNLMFVSAEATNARMDCGTQGIADTVSHDRIRGIRIFDVTDIGHPKYIANVQTCRGSHTHTVVTQPDDPDNIYIYISGSSPVRSSTELPGCTDADSDANSVKFNIEVIKVPLAHPEQSTNIGRAPILAGLAPVSRHAEITADSIAAAAARAARSGGASRPARPAGPPTGPVQCHDITVYPAIGLGGGACAGYGVLLDIRDAAHPKRIGAVSDPNFSFWHSATFNNDGSKVLFTDEWGGGTAPRCRVTDKPEWGADAVFALANNDITFKSYYKLPAAQSTTENCVAHNGSLIPIPGRDVMSQGWYQGGISVFDFTDPGHVQEIAFFDRGPLNKDSLWIGGSWSAYWYNGLIYSSEIARGLDIFELQPSAFLSQNELDAAKLVHFDFENVQSQPKFVWPAAPVVAKAYLDQLARNNGLAAEKIAAVRTGIANAEKLAGQPRKDAFTALANQVNGDAAGAMDSAKVKMLVAELTAIAGS
ncbi:MAG TPA: hypothetical protein VGI83_02025 [Gemmatimonadales bacterium]